MKSVKDAPESQENSPNYQELATRFIQGHDEVSPDAQISWEERAMILLFATWLDLGCPESGEAPKTA